MVTSRFLDTPHGPVHVRTHPGSAARTFVAVHGLGGSSFNWDVLAPHLGDATVVAADLPGFGLSKPHPGDPIEAAAAVVETLVDEAPGEVILIGNSMGGLISELVAARRRLSGLVLVAPAAPLAARRLPPDMMVFGWLVGQTLPLAGPMSIRRRVESSTPKRQVRELLSVVAARPGSVSPDYVTESERLAKLRRNLPWSYVALSDAARATGQRLLRRREYYRMVGSITAPTLLVWGTEDRLVSPFSLRELADRKPDWHAVELEGVGHVPMLEAPATLGHIVTEWLQGLTVGAVG